MSTSEPGYFVYNKPFELECGETLPGIRIAYHTYGTLNTEKNNVVWICHALTASSDAAGWWPGLVGEHDLINPGKYFIVCANILGSCYGSTGPLSTDPATGQPYYGRFPLITIRDMVKAHILLREHLKLETIHLLIGGSMGGYQAMEWCIMESDRIDRLVLLATSPTESAWGMAIHSAQRLAIEADGTWQTDSPDASARGMKAARGFGMVIYRSYTTLMQQQTDPDPEKIDHYRADSYISYQGDKLVKRFNAYSYWILTKAMDSHHMGRGRGGNADEVLATIRQKTLIIGLDSDLLCPLHEHLHMSRIIPGAGFVEIRSPYGHDGFLIEAAAISRELSAWLDEGAQ